MADPRIDPRIYGGVPQEPRSTATGAAGLALPYSPPVDVPASTVYSRPLIMEASASISADNKYTASITESVGAAVSQWLPAHLYDAATAPVFQPSPEFRANESLSQVDFVMSPTQEKYILNSRSQGEFQYKLENMRAQNLAHQAMGDNPVSAFITGALDPGYLAIDVLSLGAGRAAKLAGLGAGASRAAVGATAFGATYAAGKAEQAAVPVSETEVFLNAMVNGGAAAAVYRHGALVPRDASYPNQVLHDVTQTMRRESDDLVERATVRSEEVAATKRVPTPEDEVPTIPVMRQAREADGVSGKGKLQELARTSADPKVQVMAQRLNDMLVDDFDLVYRDMAKMGKLNRAHYSPSNNTVYMQATDDPWVLLHETAHAATAYKIAYGQTVPNSAHGKIVSEITELRHDANVYLRKNKPDAGSNASYYTKNNDEFVAGLFSQDAKFEKFLNSVPATKTGGTTILSEFVNSVRRLLGIPPSAESAFTQALGLTEQLAALPLNVNLGGDMLRFAPPQAGPLPAAAAKQAVSAAIAKNISWSLHKTLGAFSDTAKRIADLLVDDPLSMAGDSITSQVRAIRADLQGVQYVYENLLAKVMADNGFGVLNRILRPREALAAQRGVEREVGLEMLRRNRLSLDGVPITHTNVDPRITEMANSLDAVSKVALAEMKRAGVFGAEDLVEHSGYFSRRWDFSKFDDVEKSLMSGGLTQKEARQSLVDTLSIGMQRANGWDAQLASDVAGAIYDRTRAKGYFEDTVLRRHVGEDTLNEVRSVLSNSGIRGERAQRVLDILAGKVDEAGKAPQLKHRVDIALDEAVLLPDGTQRPLSDLIDFNMATTTERYLDNVSAQAAFARKGLTKSSDIVALRKELLESIPTIAEREAAADLFDNTVAALRGEPVGEKVPDFLRKAQAVTQMVGLARAGLFQFTEYATAMAHYGGLNTVTNMFKELPIARGLFSDVAEASHLRNVLARNASQDIRIRPFIQRMEDNFDIPVSDAIQLSLNQAKQLTPYLNALKYVQGHQSRVVANLIVNTLERAAKGDAKASRALSEYGLELHNRMSLQDDLRNFGMDTAKWSDQSWDEARGPLTKMMDDAVLRNRTGEIPAFAQFSSLGKFIFTFRSFVLGAHNKVLAGSLNRDGFGGLGLLMAYQFPLTFAITAADNALVKGKPETTEKTAGMAFGQMGSMGLFSEAIGVVLGNKQQFGSPGTIAIDRAYKLTGAIASGNVNMAGSAAINSIPLLSIILPVKALGEAMAEPPKD